MAEDSTPSGCFSSLLSAVGLGSKPSAQSNEQTSTSSTSKVPLDEEKNDDLRSSTPLPLNKDSKILIIGGGGTMGSSTALHLARRGYRNVHILDVFPIPSANSAGNDLNKIVGAGTSQGIKGAINQEIMKAWKTDPVFKPYYHPVGELTGAHSSPQKIAALRATYERAVKEGWAATLEWLDSEEDILRRAPHLTSGDIKGWKGLWNGDAGWAAARDAIDSVGRELNRLGVQMTFGPSGTFKEPLLSADGKTCIGVLAEDGTKWFADRVVLAAGAWSPALVDLAGQCVSKCWVIGHLQLTPEEAERYRGIPVVYHDEIGFFIEPRVETNIMKICNEFPGYTRYMKTRPFGASEDIEVSVPRSHATHPSDTMPTEGLDDIKRLIRILIPEFVGREIIDQKMCWCTDTADAQWLFCEDPRWKGLFLATGDSGHSFHTLPYVGHEIADMLEGKLSQEKQKAWGWRPGHGDPDGTGRPGPDPNDLSERPGWSHSDPESEE